MTLTATPTELELADLCDKAADIIATNGHHQRYLYDTKQAETGLPLNQCRVDILGALNIVAHDTPRYAGSPLVFAAESLLVQRIDRASLVVWNDEKGRSKDDAITLLKQTATELRTEAATS